MKVYFKATLEANRPLFEAFFSHRHSPLTMTPTTTFPRPAKPTHANNTATATTSSSHPSPTLLPSYLNLIAHLRSPVSSYITVNGASDKLICLTNQPKLLSSLSSAVKDDDSKARTATDLLVISICTVSLLRCWLPKADSSI